MNADRPSLELRARWTGSGSAGALLTVAAAIKLISRGPVFFGRDRGAINGVVFRRIKFRSMVVDAEARVDKLQDEQRGRERGARS